jgi:hypothetical protein
MRGVLIMTAVWVHGETVLAFNTLNSIFVLADIGWIDLTFHPLHGGAVN